MMRASELKNPRTFLNEEAAKRIAADLEREDEDGWRYEAEQGAGVTAKVWLIEVYDEDANWLGYL